jgi:2'-hydroxyisoflavone reductase
MQGSQHLRGFMLINIDKALAAGLGFRPLSDTIRDTLAWYKTHRSGEKLKAGILPDKEQELLHKWRATRG